jgi:hypothetical protein
MLEFASLFANYNIYFQDSSDKKLCFISPRVYIDWNIYFWY